MSRTPSPAPDAASPATHNNEHNTHTPTREIPENAQRASDDSRASSEAASNDESGSRATSTSPSAANSASTSPSAEPSASTSGTTPSGLAVPTGAWQAVWSPAHNAYYFYNSVTHETTWVNPLQQPNAEAGPSNAAKASSPAPQASSAAGPSSSTMDLYAAAAAQGIDPALAHLDPSLVAGASAPGGAYTFTAKFNARTGAFAKQDARDPSHLSEYERAKRMSEFYFDVNAWEREVEMRKLQEAQEEESKKRKRPTKKDIERYKEQKKQKKLAKTAWLRT
ncbi:hypothetical protein C8Q77DRAFT_1111186 [Trametes polyzona]|nr:hypothetical protein C8Q77DRAFT_1111186 [Trametes polyzona]